MEPRIICSTGTVTHRGLLNDYRMLIKFLGELDSEEFEFIIYPVWYEYLDDVVRELKSTGRGFPVTHSEKGIGAYFSAGSLLQKAEGLRRLEVCARAGAALGSERLVLHLWELPDSDDHIENNFAAAGDCLRIAREYGLILSVETIPCRQKDPLDYFLKLLRLYPEISYTLDTQHLGYHGLNELLFDDSMAPLWRLPEAPIHFHIRDYTGKPFDREIFKRSLHPGDGEIDLARLIGRIRENSTEHFVTLESSGLRPDGGIDVGKINKSMRYLRSL